MFMNQTGIDPGTPEGQEAFHSWMDQNPFIVTEPPVTNELQQAGDAALLSGANRAAGGGNTFQVQGGSQQGTFGTQGQEAATTQQQQSQSGSMTGTQQQKTTGTQSQTGTTTGATTGLTSTAGSRGVTDTLGFGSLLQGGAGAAQAADSSRSGFLSDLVDTGGSGFNSQVDQAVRSSLSGPGMQGVGDSAKGRAAAYATEQVANNNLNQRLGASSQLAGPTATQTLASAGNPYLGSTEAGTQASVGTNAGTQSATGTTASDTTGSTAQQTNSLGSLLGSTLTDSAQQGTSAADSRQIAAGNQPEQQNSGGGGSVVCTSLVALGMLEPWLVEVEEQYIHQHWSVYRRAARGYYLFGPALAKLVRKSKIVAYLCLPVAKACSLEVNRRAGSIGRNPWYNKVVYHVFLNFCNLLGCLVPAKPIDI